MTRVASSLPVALVTDSNFQVVSRVLNSGVEEDATALQEKTASIHKGECTTGAKTHFYRVVRGTDDLAHVALSEGQETNG